MVLPMYVGDDDGEHIWSNSVSSVTEGPAGWGQHDKLWCVPRGSCMPDSLYTVTPYIGRSFLLQPSIQVS